MCSDPENEVLEQLRLLLNKQRRGPRVDFTASFPAAQAYILFKDAASLEKDYQLKFIAPEQRKDVHVFFCEEEKYGAFAANQKFDFIVLHLGVIPTFYSFFLRLLAIPTYWPDTGDVLKETLNMAQMQAITLPAWKSWAAMPPVTPIDPIRIAFAIIFARHCLEYLVRHELGHILLGHCDYRLGRKLDAFIDDTTPAAFSISEPEVSQAFEMCADNFATVLGYEKLLHEPKLFLGKFPEPVDSAFRSFHSSRQVAIEHYLLVVFFSFRLFDHTDDAWEEDKLKSRSHPPAAFRFNSACIHLRYHLESNNRTDEAAMVQTAMTHVWDVGEEMFAAALGRQPDILYKQRILEEKAEQHFDVLNQYLQKLPQNFTTISYVKTE